jgi:hypothetical protein
VIEKKKLGLKGRVEKRKQKEKREREGEREM